MKLQIEYSGFRNPLFMAMLNNVQEYNAIGGWKKSNPVCII